MIKPLGQNILIRKILEEKKGSLILNTDDRPFKAIVVDIGSKVDLDINKDDVLLMVPYSGSKISTEDDGYLLVTEKYILGVCCP